MTMIAGVDGYKNRWIAALDDGTGQVRTEIVDSFSDLLANEELELIIIDMPIGLTDSGPRQCDRLARKRIGPRRNSVFPAPIRPMLSAESWEEACEIRVFVEAKRCSKQAFGILPKIRTIDRLMTPSSQERVREGHPEVSFSELAGKPMSHYKGKPEGGLERRLLLSHCFPDVNDILDSVRPASASVDVCDALALLWTARRVRSGSAVTLPPQPQLDSRGLRMEIVA